MRTDSMDLECLLYWKHINTVLVKNRTNETTRNGLIRVPVSIVLEAAVRKPDGMGEGQVKEAGVCSCVHEPRGTMEKGERERERERERDHEGG